MSRASSRFWPSATTKRRGAKGRGHDSDFAAEVVASFANPALDYEQASVRSRRMGETASKRVLRADVAGVLYEDAAQAAADALLRDNQLVRRTLSFPLSPAAIEMMPGDALQLADGPDGIYVVTRVEEGDVRRIEAGAHEPAAPLAAMSGSAERSSSATVSAGFSPIVHLMDLPRFDGSDAASFARAACFCRPFRRMLLSSSATVEGYRARGGRRAAGHCRASEPKPVGRGIRPLRPVGPGGTRSVFWRAVLRG